MKSPLIKKKKDAEAAPANNTPKDKLNRIRIGGIKRLIACVVVLLALCVPALYLGSIYGYLPALMLLAAIAVSYFYLRMLGKRLSYTEKSDIANCVRGREVEFTVTLVNKSGLVYPKVEATFFISDLFGGDDSLMRSEFTLAAHETRDFIFGVKFDHIGTYTAGLRKLRLFGLFGLFELDIPNDNEYKVDVSPRLYDFAKLEISEAVLAESQQQLTLSTAEGMDYTGVRDYAYGDPIKNIHWKLSAHAPGGYLTKLLENYSNSSMSVVLDFYSPAYPAETLMSLFDCIVESGLSAAKYASENGMDYSIIYFDRSGEELHYKPTEFGSMAEMVRELPPITTNRNEYDALPLLRDQITSLYGMGNIAYCTASVGEDVSHALLDAKNMGKNPLLFYIIPKDVYDDERRALLMPLRVLEASNITYYVIATDKNVEI